MINYSVANYSVANYTSQCMYELVGGLGSSIMLMQVPTVKVASVHGRKQSRDDWWVFRTASVFEVGRPTRDKSGVFIDVNSVDLVRYSPRAMFQ